MTDVTRMPPTADSVETIQTTGAGADRGVDDGPPEEPSSTPPPDERPPSPPPRAVGLPPETLLPELEYACTSGVVTFDQLIEAAFMRQHQFNTVEQTRAAYEHYFPRLLDSFAVSHEGISRVYYASRIKAAAVLTKDKELFLKLPDTVVKDVEAVELISQLMLLHIRARQYLDREDYQACLEPVFQVIVFCLSVFDTGQVVDTRQAGGTSDPPLEEVSRPELMRLLKNESARAERHLWEMVSRKALIQYFNGMLVGLLVLALLVGGIAIAPPLFSAGTDPSNDLLQWAAAGGGVGAFISVLQRITGGKFALSRATVTLQRRRRISMLVLLGALRPAVGAIFGVVFYAFQTAGLIPFTTSSEVDAGVYFAAMGFIVGFSERFARDMVLAAEPRSGATAAEVPSLTTREPAHTGG